MPIDIKELIVRVRLDTEPGTKEAGAKQDGGAEREDLIAECVEQVLEILRQKEER
jgi:hypothetical protein